MIETIIVVLVLVGVLILGIKIYKKEKLEVVDNDSKVKILNSSIEEAETKLKAFEEQNKRTVSLAYTHGDYVARLILYRSSIEKTSNILLVSKANGNYRFLNIKASNGNVDNIAYVYDDILKDLLTSNITLINVEEKTVQEYLNSEGELAEYLRRLFSISFNNTEVFNYNGFDCIWFSPSKVIKYKVPANKDVLELRRIIETRKEVLEIGLTVVKTSYIEAIRLVRIAFPDETDETYHQIIKEFCYQYSIKYLIDEDRFERNII